MFRVINEYMTKVKLKSDEQIKLTIENFLRECPDIKSYTVMVNFNQYIVDIRLKEYDIEKVNEVFGCFNKEVSYDYSSLYIRYNEGKCVRYRYITSKENKEAFYCDILFN